MYQQLRKKPLQKMPEWQAVSLDVLSGRVCTHTRAHTHILPPPNGTGTILSYGVTMGLMVSPGDILGLVSTVIPEPL